VNRRRRPRRHTNHERWLVSYADFITLLFAFFVVLYASSQVDKRKVSKLALAIQVAFQEMGAFPSSTGIAERTSKLPPLASLHANSVAGSSDQNDLATLQSELQQALQREIAMRQVLLHRETDGLVITLREFGFFASGSASFKPESLPALDRIASILAIRTYKLRIEGHTDNVPIHTAQMASNWELSASRATELVRLLIQRYRFAPSRLSAAGYAEYHPMASNLTAQGRAQNRRVDIVILADQAPPLAATEAPGSPEPAP
jgi:chemotaxis protein MotB